MHTKDLVNEAKVNKKDWNQRRKVGGIVIRKYLEVVPRRKIEDCRMYSCQLVAVEGNLFS